MPSLYEIDQAIMGCIDPETGEILDVDALDALRMERDAKVEAVALWIKNLNADAAAYKAEKAAFEKREKAALNKVEQLKKWLAIALDGKKFNTAKCAVTFRKTERVEVWDAEKLPKEMLIAKLDISPDKKAIREAFKAGQPVEGCALIENISASVK